MSGLNTFADLNIIPSSSYDVLIHMDWVNTHHAILDSHNKTYTCLDEEESRVTVRGIPRLVSLIYITSL